MSLDQRHLEVIVALALKQVPADLCKAYAGKRPRHWQEAEKAGEAMARQIAAAIVEQMEVTQKVVRYDGGASASIAAAQAAQEPPETGRT